MDRLPIAIHRGRLRVLASVLMRQPALTDCDKPGGPVSPGFCRHVRLPKQFRTPCRKPEFRRPAILSRDEPASLVGSLKGKLSNQSLAGPAASWLRLALRSPRIGDKARISDVGALQLFRSYNFRKGRQLQLAVQTRTRIQVPADRTRQRSPGRLG